MADYILNGDEITDAASFYTEIAKVCGFPGYFGRNLDALNDCLGELPKGSRISWLNVHPYLRNSRPIGNPPKNMLDWMEEMCRDHGHQFCA